jgi:hypothetical protein
VFRDIDIKLPSEDVGAFLKDALLTAYGSYPVFEITEENEDPMMNDIYGRGQSFWIDAERLDRIDDGCLRYVQHILAKSLRLPLIERKYFEHNGSRKYSFGDTPDWWDEARLDTLPCDRIVIRIDVVVS